MSLFVSVLANTSGTGPKKPIKPSSLYRPHLTDKKTRRRVETPEEAEAWKKAAIEEYEQYMRDQMDAKGVSPDA